LFALAASRYALHVPVYATRRSLQEHALEAARLVHEMTPENPKTAFVLATVLADRREVGLSDFP
jgi:hypothetical protein